MPKVLVVDDSLSVRKVVQRALESRRIEVLSAASGSEALEQIGREAPDLIVCDVIMPDMDGYHICDFVKKHPTLRRTPVLLISGIVNGTVLESAIPTVDLKALLDGVAQLPGVSLTALIDREGALMEAAGGLLLEAALTGALASCLVGSTDGVGQALAQGRLQSVMLEYDAGVV